MLMTSNIIIYAHFLLHVIEFKSNFTDKFFIYNIINQVIDQIFFKSKLNNTPMDPCSESDEFGPTNLILNVHINIF